MKPSARAEVEGMTGAGIVSWLAADPKRLRRPIIDDGTRIYLGFTKTVRHELGGA